LSELIRRWREQYRAQATIPVSLYSFDSETTGPVEWRSGLVAGAPAIELCMSPGTVLVSRVALPGRRFTFSSTVTADGAVGAACVCAVSVRGGGGLRRTAVAVRSGGPPVLLEFTSPVVEDLDLVLTVDAAPSPVRVLWSTPRLLIERPLTELDRSARARLRAAWADGGVRHVIGEIAAAVTPGRGWDSDDARYARWIARTRLTPRLREAMRSDLETLRYQPLVSLVLMAPAGTDPQAVSRCLASAQGQLYPKWELVREPRLGGALRAAKGEFIALLEGDGELAPEALAEIVRELNRHPDADVVYSDEDRLEDGRRRAPFFKPDWSPEYSRARPYVGQFAVYRATLLDAVAGVGDDAAPLHELGVRAVEKTSRVGHVPKILWHGFGPRGQPTGRGAGGGRGAGPRPVTEAPTVSAEPLVSIIILTRDQVHLLRRCLHSISAKTRGAAYEVLIVDNGSIREDTLRFLGTCGHLRIPAPGPFNFAGLNNLGARHARGRHLLFLNNDTEVIDEEWLAALVEHSHRGPVGAVGAKLYYPDGRLQHVGMVLGIKAGVAHAFRGAPGTHPGYFDSAVVTRNYSAVTGACLMTRRDVFESLGGFNEAFAVDYNDVDYCLRAQARGYRVVFTPAARLWHHESVTRPRRVDPVEHALFHRVWATAVARDPYYNPNLSTRDIDFRVDA
jgi:GT2 family glycosyltransferase